MSSRKNFLYPYHGIAAGDMSGNLTSPATFIGYLNNIAIQLNWSGSPTGTFVVEVSNDYVPGPQGQAALNTGNWQALSLSPSLGAPGGSAASTGAQITNLAFAYLRVRYARSSGTGSLDYYISGKG